MQIFTSVFNKSTVSGLIAVTVFAVVGSVGFVAPSTVSAFGEWDDCCGSDYDFGGGSYDYDFGGSSDYDFGSSYDYDFGSTYDYDFGSSYDYDFGSSYDYDFGSTYDYDFANLGSEYIIGEYDYGNEYIIGEYGYGNEQIIGEYGVSQPGYSTPVAYNQGGYSTPARGGYSTPARSGGYSTPAPRTTVRPAPPGRPVATPQPPIYYPPQQPQPPVYHPPVYNPPKPVPTCTIWAGSVVNGHATLTWNSYNATSAMLSGEGSVSVNGSRQVSNITGTRVYTLTVSGQGGSTSCSTTVYFQQTAPTCTAYATPTSVQQGGSTTVTWNSQNATSATLTEAGTVSVNGSRTFTNLQTTKTYTVTVTGPGGTNTCSASVGVYPVEHPQNRPSCTIWANPNIVGYGQATVLTWNSYSATSASINTIGSVSLNGSQSVVPNGQMTYVMTVYGNGGSNTCSTTVYTQAQPPHYPPQPPYYPPTTNLYCSITANPGAIQNGQSAVLNWTSYGAVSAWLSDGLGTVNVNGSLTVRPESSRNYTLTIRDAYGKQVTCNAALTVSGGMPYVSLTSIPYTGLDLGVFGSLAYWMALLAFALGAAYLTVGFRGGIVGAVYGLMAEVNGPRRVTPNAVILEETIIPKEASTYNTANEDVIAEAVQGGTTSDAMTLEGDGEMPRLVIRRA